jgi:hypothetical protein
LHADILEGHLSSALCHTGNISYRLGQQKSQEEIAGTLKSSHDMTEAFGRMSEHLAENKVDLSKDHLTLGAGLSMDPKTERFTDNEKANAMLTREYRAPFTISAAV